MIGEWDGLSRRILVVVCVILIAPGRAPLLVAQGPPPATQGSTSAAGEKPKKTPEQLDSLVAPIALYPDPLLAQVLAACTYPLEVVQCSRWLKENSTLKGEELTKAAAKQPWDASVQALVAFPSALKLLDDNLQWSTDLGNAVLDQQGEVMDAVQRMRKKAKDGGKLETTQEQKVEVTTVESKSVIEIKPADPQVIYVPSYNPTVVYGPPVYAYPPVVYPTYSAGAVAATAAVSFGVGVMMGAFWSGCCHSGYGWGVGWGHTDITINNNFNQRYGYANVSGGNRTNIQGGTSIQGGTRQNNSWQHNPEHRRSVPYSDRTTAQRFEGSGRDSANRTQRVDARNQSIGDRGGVGDRGNRGAARDPGANRDRDRGASQDRIGDRDIGRDTGSRQSAFSGAESRASAEAASNRGFSSSRQSSMGSSSGRSSARSAQGGGGRSFGGGRRR